MNCEVLYAQAGGISSVLHGSGIFYRGGTHVLSVLTLGGPEDRHMVDGMQTKAEKRFMHHYNFPPYSSGRNRSRRDLPTVEKLVTGRLPKKRSPWFCHPRWIFLTPYEWFLNLWLPMVLLHRLQSALPLWH